MAEGFLGRWSKRKLDVKEGRPVETPPLVATPPEPLSTVPVVAEVPAVALEQDPAAPESPPLTLDDVKALTPESDFTRFVAPDVTPEVKNAAMKKLFADPHYNVMDGLDVYVDDYSKPDPMPEGMLAQLASTQFLRLVTQELQARDVADNPKTQSVAQSEAALPAVPEPSDHADPDLQLQQDDAAPGEDSGERTE